MNNYELLEPNCVTSLQQQEHSLCENCRGTENGGGNSNSSDSSGQLFTIVSDSRVQASNASGTRDWRSFITNECRDHFICKIVLAIFPTPEPADMLDERMHNLVAFAKKVEVEVCEMANSMTHYHYLLAQRILQIQNEVEKKRQTYKERQQREAQIAQHQGGTTSATATTSQQLQPLNQNQIDAFNLHIQQSSSVVNQNQMGQQVKEYSCIFYGRM